MSEYSQDMQRLFDNYDGHISNKLSAKYRGELDKYLKKIAENYGVEYKEDSTQPPQFRIIVQEGASAYAAIIKVIPKLAERGNLPYWLDNGSRALLSFELEPYPACCAMYQVNHFSYRVLSQECISDLMDGIFKVIQLKRTRLKRIVFNFVEIPRYDEARNILYKFGDIPPQIEVPDMKMAYPHLYRWATSKKHQQLLTVNHNTDNIIHFVDCMIGEL